jgi:DNA mismatch repair protein MSH4
MAPPTQLSTIDARLDLVDELLGDEDFFYAIFDHLASLPELDKMLSYMALVPKLSSSSSTCRGGKKSPHDRNWVVTPGMASRGISALVCIKTALSVLPTFANAIESHLRIMEARDVQRRRNQPDTTTNNNNNKNDRVEEDEETCRVQDDATSYDILNDDGTVLCGHFTYTGEFTVTPSPKNSSNRRRTSRKKKHPPPKSLLLRAILYTMRQPDLKEILDCVCNIFTESTTYSRNTHAMRHQECFAIKPNKDGMMDILRKAFLANVDDIYRLADEYAEEFGLTVTVKETTSRGYYLSIPAYAAADLPAIFIQPVKTGRFIHCSTEEVRSYFLFYYW